MLEVKRFEQKEIFNSGSLWYYNQPDSYRIICFMAYMNRILLSPPNSAEARYGQHKNWLTHIFQLFNDSLVFKSWVKNDQSRELLGK